MTPELEARARALNCTCDDVDCKMMAEMLIEIDRLRAELELREKENQKLHEQVLELEKRLKRACITLTALGCKVLDAPSGGGE